jgi:oxygen-independent coproporphyrinogen-3 oxidase
MGETMMMGLRLLDEGVTFRRFRERFGTELKQQYAAILPGLQELDLIELCPDRIRLSRRGHLLGNHVFAQFLPALP